MRFAIAALSASCFLPITQANAATLCTMLSDVASQRIILQQGDCQTRVTPASTFKIPLAVIGYDAGFLKDAHHPSLDFKAGDPAWGGANWQRATNPMDWLKYSVVWYSQRITRALGEARLHDDLVKFNYGNADMSGDAGKNNGLERAWIASSLQISPQEQADFLKKLLRSELPVSRKAMQQAIAIVEKTPLGDGWTLHGKTGGAFPRRADGRFDYARGWGWYVGWVENGQQSFTFVRLTQDRERHAESPGLRAKAALLADMPGLLQQATYSGQ